MLFGNSVVNWDFARGPGLAWMSALEARTQNRFVPESLKPPGSANSMREEKFLSGKVRISG
jgi:hypothetical protein